MNQYGRFWTLKYKIFGIRCDDVTRTILDRKYDFGYNLNIVADKHVLPLHCLCPPFLAECCLYITRMYINSKANRTAHIL